MMTTIKNGMSLGVGVEKNQQKWTDAYFIASCWYVLMKRNSALEGAGPPVAVRERIAAACLRCVFIAFRPRK
jgi:hypothetical protein